MEKMELNAFTKKIFRKSILYILLVILYMEILLVAELHFTVSFFPIPFFFHLCFWVIWPLLVKFALKKEWCKCAKDDFLCIKYIIIPYMIIGLGIILLSILYYPHGTQQALQQILES